MIKKESIIGHWRSFKVIWGGITMDQGENNYTHFQFLNDGCLFTETMVEKRKFLEDRKSTWDIQKKDQVIYLFIDNLPHYEIVGYNENEIILKTSSSLTLHFKRKFE